MFGCAGHGSAWLERLVRDQEVGSSNLPAPTIPMGKGIGDSTLSFSEEPKEVAQMRVVFWVMSCLLMFCGTALAVQSTEAKAALVDSHGQNVGEATLKEVSGEVKIQLKVSKLPPGVHGLHIHAVGKCEPPDFKSAGGHFNPYGMQHGMLNTQGGAHAGDLPNIGVGSDGTVDAEIIAQRVTLRPGENSLFQRGGTSLVIDAPPDNERTDPADKPGDRIACGGIEPLPKTH